MMKEYFKAIKWSKWLHIAIIGVFIFYINFFLVNQQLLKDGSSRQIKEVFSNFQVLGILLYIISIIGLALYFSKNLKKSFFWQYGISYLIYLIVSYFLVVTRNLNNGSFKFRSLGNNHFLQWYSLPTIAGILILALIISLLKSHWKSGSRSRRSRLEQYFLSLDSFLKTYESPQMAVAVLIGTAISNDHLTISALRSSMLSLLNGKHISEYIWTLVFNLLVCLIVYSLLSYWALKAVEDGIKKKASVSLAITTSFLLAVVFNYSLQSGIKAHTQVLGRFIFPGATLYQIFVIALVNIVIYLIINRYLLTTTILVALGVLLSVANSIKFSMRNEPVLFSDLSWLKDIKMLLSYIDGKMIIFASAAIIILAIIIFIIQKLLSFQDTVHKEWKVRVFLILPIIALSLIVVSIFRQQDDGKIPDGIPLLSRLNNTEEIEWMGQAVVARERSLMFVWTKQLTSVTMEKPSGYSKLAMDRLAEKYTKKAAVINKTRKKDISDQTVIFVLSESFSDPSRLSGVTLSGNPLSYIKSVKGSYTSGLMKADSYGGGTANMEFQTLTGLPMYNFSPSISTIYTEVVPDMKRIPAISDSFSKKDKIAIHLGDANTYSRRTIYRELGFDTFIAADGGTKKGKHLGEVGVYPSDANTYTTVLDNINPKQSQFFSVITYQNHTPWYYTDASPYSGTGKGFSSAENGFLNNYLKLLNQTDQATKNWLNQLSKIDKKITVVFYGDHLPGFYPESTFKKKPETQYQTDYFIWSNYPTTKQNHPYVNSSDFPAELLAETSSRVSPYQALLTEVLNKASVNQKQRTKEQKKIAHDLKLVEYDLVSGKGYLNSNDKFFKVPGEK